MRYRWPCQWPCVALAWVLFPWVFCAGAVPEVKVAVSASFKPAAYLLELLETAADENQTAYFPLLDRVAEGRFSHARTDEELYTVFLQTLQDDGHVSDADALASFQFALSLRSAAPRIEAHYQFYNTSIRPPAVGAEGECRTWVHFNGRRYCSPLLHESEGIKLGHKDVRELQFDRVLSVGPDLPSSILYADVLDPAFGHFHGILSKSAREGKTSYRVRYAPPRSGDSQALLVNGYGVELALKRTDYIVIDDRDQDSQASKKQAEVSDPAKVDEQERTELRPLSKSELAQLGLRTASFVLDHPEPFASLLNVTQDFPAYSSKIVDHEISEVVLKQLRDDRTMRLPMGYNVFWMNGVQLDARQIDAHALLHHLRRERRLISQLKEFGLSGPEAIKVLAQTSIAKSKTVSGPQRYDFRDESEGGKVVIWMNNLQKDTRYQAWPSDLSAVLQRTYPGQLPPVKREIHNLVVPVDFSDAEDVGLVVEGLQSFVKRAIPIRFGLVPLVSSDAATEQARILYYLLDAYGLPSVLSYLETCLQNKNCAKPDKSSFNNAIRDRTLHKNQEAKSLQEVLGWTELDAALSKVRAYNKRLGTSKTSPVVFINGVALPRTDEWLTAVINRVNTDLQAIQEVIYQGAFDENTWLPGHFLTNAAAKRNTLIMPEDEGDLRFLDLSKVYTRHKMPIENLPCWKARDMSTKEDWSQLIVVADLGTASGKNILRDTLEVLGNDPHLEVMLLHNPANSSQTSNIFGFVNGLYEEQPALKDSFMGDPDRINSLQFWQSMRPLIDMLGYHSGETGLILNGRRVGPIPSASDFDQDVIGRLLQYERAERAKPLHTALKSLGLEEKVKDYATVARLLSVVSLSAKAEVPEGIFEATSTSRIDFFEEWDSAQTTIAVGDQEAASIQIVVALDPASETAQRWVPIMQVLSELSGIHVRIFLNPRDMLQELPVKRFYRHVLQSKPSFADDGSVEGLSARFGEMPEEALLTIGLDVPPSWLVMPKESIHDLDNIKLSNVKRDNDIYALYELEHILIEGHSRDMNTGAPPRGVQLMLGTAKDPHVTDTIVMANLGYFQFKASPGVWNVDLLPGRSREVFSIDSVGPRGYVAQPGDETTVVELISFQGKTLFPRLSRRPGHETDDVLEVTTNRADPIAGYLTKGLDYAQALLSKVGIGKGPRHADINIFSVASGHLYERMLNIMMVSVMKHTKHTVKFWFIEQFLSPSFKDSIPLLAAEYGFEYEMVTYKWPHWLRAQREKQREIWGYKILFLDVLFPLSLDKVIFVDADQIVRTDMYDLVRHDLEGAAYGFTPMCDSRTEMEGFRFWKQGYWRNYLRGLPYHISALYVVDLGKFRQIAAGDRLRQQYHQLSADPNSLSNLDQDLPNHMQHTLPIHSLPQEWLWCETWCSDEALVQARTIDLCNNPMTKEPKLDRARRQVPEWTAYDDEIRAVIQRRRQGGVEAATESESTVVVSSPSSSHGEAGVSYKEEL